jgi:hypothetical protein
MIFSHYHYYDPLPLLMTHVFLKLRFLGFGIAVIVRASEQLTRVDHLLMTGSTPNAFKEPTIVVESKLCGTSIMHL